MGAKMVGCDTCRYIGNNSACEFCGDEKSEYKPREVSMKLKFLGNMFLDGFIEKLLELKLKVGGHWHVETFKDSEGRIYADLMLDGLQLKEIFEKIFIDEGEPEEAEEQDEGEPEEYTEVVK